MVNLHLLKSEDLSSPNVKFFGKKDQDDTVSMSKFIEGDVDLDSPNLDYLPTEEGGPGFKTRGNIFINPGKCFTPVNKDVWDYQIGGYQVLEKWLKDRKGKRLSSEDIQHYCKIITVLARTIEIQIEIDRLYPKVEESLSKI